MDSLYQSTSPGQNKFYSPEIATKGCVVEKNTGQIYDSRYTQSGLNTNQLAVQQQNGVLDHLEWQPSYHVLGPSRREKEAYKLSSWNRPTIGWSLTCDVNGNTRAEGYEAASTDLEMFQKSR